ncbi:4a-hydroxytetrahydrobiopterin dehydratase [Agarivorans sp. Toyoura001]|uniref:4a-hydroxytetrahydrobiopterin dehydratase n=1 Tax=unclassified Agarivorans TaxID=2636026 RepID=UPI0010CEA906|nr:4a-hydroxytetrahydrobiopterin dehydratase [Agarivorans sp. Toyoura001]GDY24652.1 putative pterin-4-alpha-carbinolamine dehydratase [Agarivorans sp. Toyoura001]
MSDEQALSPSAIQMALKHLPDWQFNNNSIENSYRFKDFVQAFEFMGHVADYAEQQNHHPDWSNCYNRVNIALTTHELGGVSERDFKLATLIEELYQKYY